MSLVSRSAVFLSAVVVLGLSAATFAATLESVDFSKPPQAGSKFKFTETTKMNMKGSQEAGGNEMEMSITGNGKEVFTHTILEVKENKITKIEREYEDAGMKQTIEMSVLPEPREQEQPDPLAWKTVRAEIEDDAFTMKVKDGDEWTEAEEKIRKKFTPELLRHPLIPLPKGTKEVGESWSLQGEELKKIFPPTRFGEEGGELDGKYKATLDGIAEVNGIRCAVIKVQGEINLQPREGVEVKLVLNGKAHYSLQHNFVIAMVMKGMISQKADVEQMGTQITSSLTGDLTVDVKVKVLGGSDE